MGSYLASIYQYLYLAVVSVLTFFQVGRYRKSIAGIPNNSTARELLLVLIAVMAIGLRPISGYFVDMSTYSAKLSLLQSEQFIFTTDTDNIIFDNLFLWWGCNGFDQHLFFLLIAIIYFVCAYVGIKRLFPGHALIAYLVFLAAFSTFSYSTNGIKAGAAASIFIMALGYMNKFWICLPLMLVSLGFHHSMIMPIAAFLVTVFIKNPKLYYIGWVVCFLLACFHVTYFQELFGGMADEQGASYLLATEETTTFHIGFRPDFVIYSVMPVIIGYVFEIKKKVVLSKTYSTLLHFYITANAVWMLCMYASFTNRIAYLSWFVYPIVIIYPFLDRMNLDPYKYRKLRKTVLYHLFFTLFMVFIYYGVFSLGH